MEFNGTTFQRPPTVPERRHPPGVLVQNTLRVWAQSRVRGAEALTRAFLDAGYAHLPPGTPAMYELEVSLDFFDNIRMIAVNFRNPFDAEHLLGQVFWCGCESIFFTICNIFTGTESMFPHPNQMHSLPY